MKYRLPCLDSSVFIGGLKDEIKKRVKRGVVYRFLLERARAHEFRMRMSAVAIAEVYKKRGASTLSGTGLDDFLALLDEDLIDVIEVDRNTALQAHKLCREYGGRLRPMDAVHLACALSAKSEVLLAWDGPLTTIRRDDIRIEEPVVYDLDLFSETPVATAEEQAEYDATHPSVREALNLQRSTSLNAAVRKHVAALPSRRRRMVTEAITRTFLR